MVCSDHKKHTGYVTERDDGNARRQFVPTNCACSPPLADGGEGRNHIRSHRLQP